jgi:hypothetical protein
MRVSLMSPRVSVERNAVAPIGKPMAFRHIAAEDEHRDVDAGAVDFDFAGEERRCGFGALGVARHLRARARRARGSANALALSRPTSLGAA